MGRQVNFYLGPADQAPFEQAIAAAGGMAILASRSNSPLPVRLPSTVVTRFGEEWLRVILTRESDLVAIRCQPITGRDEFYCSAPEASVVEFDRCFASAEFIRRGRLYFEPNGRDAGFVAWADQLLKTARKSLTRLDNGDYAGAEALRLHGAGARFEPL